MTNYLKLITMVLPFVAFIAGYGGSLLYMHASVEEVPAIVGKNVHDAAMALGEKNLGLKVLSLKEDAYFAAGTIISQVPRAGQNIKVSRPVLVVATKKPNPLLMPDCYDKTSDEIAVLLKELQLYGAVKIVAVESNHTNGKCFAQFPTAGNEIAGQQIVAYLAKQDQKLYVMPTLIGLPSSQAQEYLQYEHISCELFTFSEHEIENKELVVIDQKPMAGTIVTLDKLHVQLNVGVG